MLLISAFETDKKCILLNSVQSLHLSTVYITTVNDFLIVFL